MLKIQFKATDPVSLKQPLADYIKDVYSMNPDQFAADLQLLDAMRSEVVSPETHEQSLNKLIKYYGQLSFVCGKIPLDDNSGADSSSASGSSVRVPWRYYSSFASSGSAKNKPVSSFSGDFEKAHLLFNIGAMYNQLGHSALSLVGLKCSVGADSVKKAANYFQTSAGVFQEIADNYSTKMQSTGPNPEMSLTAMECLIAINLGLAQECFFHKIMIDVDSGASKVKDGTIAKIASRASELYNQAYEYANKTLQSPTSSKCIFPTEWLVAMQMRAVWMNAIAQYRKSREVVETGKYGEEIARLHMAELYVKKALDFHKALSDLVVKELKSFQSLLQDQLKRSEKDNDVVYLDPIPSQASLSAIDKAALSSAIAFPPLSSPSMTSIVGKPLFEKLYPYMIYTQIQAYNDRKSIIVKSIADKLQKQNDEYNEVLRCRNLPSVIQAYEQPIGLPQEIIQKSTEVKQVGGAMSLQQQLQTLNVLAQEDQELLAQIRRQLEDEQKDDEECRDRFGVSRWTRTRSLELQRNLREQLDKREKLVSTARQSDLLVKSKFDSNLPHIESLSSSRQELESLIPASSQSTSLAKNDQDVMQVKASMQSLDDLVKMRAQLIDQCRQQSAKDDIGTQLLEAYARKDTNYDVIFSARLKAYDQFHQSCESFALKQTQLVNQLREAFERFNRKKQSNDALKSREIALNNLDLGYKAFKELSNNLQEGIKFYSDLQSALQRLKSQVDDYVTARSIEKKDMLKDLTEGLAGMNLGTSGNGQNNYHSQYSSPAQQYQNASAPQYQNATAPQYQLNAPTLPPRPSGYGYADTPPQQTTWNPGQPLQYGNSGQNQNYYQQQPPSYQYGNNYGGSQPNRYQGPN
ncbi:hypothetical protein MP228_002341 [Amoeboaphelidium protococcarum]|nr:hypothetical protein MP228_002341 [Amoeboaphelidium protococcarum]